MIVLKDLCFRYDRHKTVFQDLELTLPTGNIFGLLGKNGVGKSTLLKLLAGLLYPTGGKIEVEGYRPQDRHPAFLQEVYLVPEEFHMPAMAGKTYVKLYSPFYPRFNKELFKACMEEFQLDERAKLSSLSYGQKKKFLLSFGLATDCKFLILDEPTNGLDIPSKSQFRKVVANAIHESRSFIISSHQIKDIENLIDPIIIMDQGKIVFHYSMEEISRKLAFVKTSRIEGAKKVIYYEESLGSYNAVVENTTGEDTRMNMEMLFNAVVTYPEKIKETLDK